MWGSDLQSIRYVITWQGYHDILSCDPHNHLSWLTDYVIIEFYGKYRNLPVLIRVYTTLIYTQYIENSSAHSNILETHVYWIATEA